MATTTTITGPTPAANMTLLKTTYAIMGTLGEAARAQDFLLTFEDDATVLPYLVQTATTPTIKREVVETVGPYGVRSIQQGRWMNEMELAVSFKEVVKLTAYNKLVTWAQNKTYQIVTLSHISETISTPSTWTITDCWIELDGADLSVEDAIPLKISGTLHGSFFPIANA